MILKNYRTIFIYFVNKYEVKSDNFKILPDNFKKFSENIKLIPEDFKNHFLLLSHRTILKICTNNQYGVLPDYFNNYGQNQIVLSPTQCCLLTSKISNCKNGRCFLHMNNNPKSSFPATSCHVKVVFFRKLNLNEKHNLGVLLQ